MNTPDLQVNEPAVLGRKYAFATASLLLGIASFISLLGLEKGILAVIFGMLALRAQPLPALAPRRSWAKTGVALGAIYLALVLVIMLAGWPLVVGLLGYAADSGKAMLHGPKMVMSVGSPDGEFTAYVEDLPSIDPPNQALFVERRDQRHFMHVGSLAEDVDSIERILWAPDSRIVVFQSRDYLTATRLADWQTVRVFLGQEWTRHQPGRRATFTSGGRRRTVTAIEFDVPDGFSYRLQGDDRLRRVDFNALTVSTMKSSVIRGKMPDIIVQHHRGLVTAETAEEWFGITPESTKALRRAAEAEQQAQIVAFPVKAAA
jgi:hypothetical protein